VTLATGTGLSKKEFGTPLETSSLFSYVDRIWKVVFAKKSGCVRQSLVILAKDPMWLRGKNWVPQHWMHFCSTSQRRCSAFHVLTRLVDITKVCTCSVLCGRSFQNFLTSLALGRQANGSHKTFHFVCQIQERSSDRFVNLLNQFLESQQACCEAKGARDVWMTH